jgi:hypothetical protein
MSAIAHPFFVCIFAALPIFTLDKSSEWRKIISTNIELNKEVQYD